MAPIKWFDVPFIAKNTSMGNLVKFGGTNEDKNSR